LSENKEAKFSEDQLKAKIATWQNRAYMAQQQGNVDLVEKALEHKRKYSKLLSELKAG
jgi:hypothetical protein